MYNVAMFNQLLIVPQGRCKDVGVDFLKLEFLRRRHAKWVFEIETSSSLHLPSSVRSQLD